MRDTTRMGTGRVDDDAATKARVNSRRPSRSAIRRSVCVPCPLTFNAGRCCGEPEIVVRPAGSLDEQVAKPPIRTMWRSRSVLVICRFSSQIRSGPPSLERWTCWYPPRPRSCSIAAWIMRCARPDSEPMETTPAEACVPNAADSEIAVRATGRGEVARGGTKGIAAGPMRDRCRAAALLNAQNRPGASSVPRPDPMPTVISAQRHRTRQ